MKTKTLISNLLNSVKYEYVIREYINTTFATIEALELLQ